MTYYLANLEFGKDHTITATYRVLNFTFPLGTRQQRQLGETILQIPMTLEQMSLGGAATSFTQEVPAGGRPAGGGE